MGAVRWARRCVVRPVIVALVLTPVIVALVLTLAVCALLVWTLGVRHG